MSTSAQALLPGGGAGALEGQRVGGSVWRFCYSKRTHMESQAGQQVLLNSAEGHCATAVASGRNGSR